MNINTHPGAGWGGEREEEDRVEEIREKILSCA